MSIFFTIMYELVLPVLPLTVGFLLGTSIKQYLEMIYTFLFGVKDTVTDVFSTAVVLRDSGALMIRETYDTSVMLIWNILDGILVPFVHTSNAVMVIVKPGVELVIVIMKALILALQQASALVIIIVETTSTILTSLFTTIHNLATNTTATLTSWTSWVYKGTSDTLFNTLLYVVGIYLCAQLLILFTKRLVKKIK